MQGQGLMIMTYFGQHWTWISSASLIVPRHRQNSMAQQEQVSELPSLFELYGQWGGNMNLNPEKSFVL
jgi:outer membrane cobalamin receptor